MSDLQRYEPRRSDGKVVRHDEGRFVTWEQHKDEVERLANEYAMTKQSFTDYVEEKDAEVERLKERNRVLCTRLDVIRERLLELRSELKKRTAESFEYGAEVERLKASVTKRNDCIERLLTWVRIHAQQNPGHNGNRFDDVLMAKGLLKESGIEIHVREGARR